MTTRQGVHRYRLGRLRALLRRRPAPKVAILGAGFGGIEFVKALPENKFQVLLFDRNNYHTFQPLLYQVAIGGLHSKHLRGFPLSPSCP